VDDLKTNVAQLRDGILFHNPSPYDPELLKADLGEKHLSVFPLGDQAQVAEPLVTGPGGDLLTEVYRVMYWEHSGDEPAAGLADRDAAEDLLALAQAVRDRFYVTANLTLGGAFHVRYLGTVFPERSGLTRWFVVGVQVQRPIDVTG
jgi:hypothetical protein